MNAKEYADYCASVERNLKGLEFVSTGACPGCAECGLEDKSECSEHDRELAEEAHFSWQPCDSCGSSLGGDRHPAHGWLKREGQPDLLLHLNVCTDCLYFLNYGQLDDQAMMEIEDSKA